MDIITGQKPALPTLRDPAQETKMRAAAEQFEAVFISQMMSPMFDTLPTDGALSGGPGEQMFRSMLVDQYGQEIAKKGGVGVSDAVYREMLRMQELH